MSLFFVSPLAEGICRFKQLPIHVSRTTAPIYKNVHRDACGGVDIHIYIVYICVVSSNVTYSLRVQRRNARLHVAGASSCFFYFKSGRPGGVVCYPRACYRSISWVRVPPNAYSYKFIGNFSCARIDSRKARKRELATLFRWKSTSSGNAEPYAR